ncbi:MAG: LytTR family DNA-binding domain-containing protein [Bacteroidota bacterium]
MKINCLIVDDERPALQLLSAYLDKIPHLQLIDTCESGLEALTILQKDTIDLLLLDVQMPHLTGLELLQSLTRPPVVILTTAHREFAVEGFELDVADYLVKPFSFNRFVKAINKATKRLQPKKEKAKLTNPKEASQSERSLFIKTAHKIEQLSLEDILYLESMREYIRIHTKEKRYLVHQTMNNMEEKLSDARFIRVHRSYLIAFDRIDSIQGNTLKINGQVIPIGGSYRKAFFEQIKLF